MWGVEIQPLSRLTSALDKGEGSTSHPGRVTLGKECQYSLNSRLGVPGAGLDVLQKR